MTEKTTYVTALYRGGAIIWFVLDKPPIGFPQRTIRLKIGSHYYFVSAQSPIVDAASGTTLVFVQATTHHSVFGSNITPEGAVYEVTKIDPNDFHIDANWREIDNPFPAVE